MLRRRVSVTLPICELRHFVLTAKALNAAGCSFYTVEIQVGNTSTAVNLGTHERLTWI